MEGAGLSHPVTTVVARLALVNLTVHKADPRTTRGHGGINDDDGACPEGSHIYRPLIALIALMIQCCAAAVADDNVNVVTTGRLKEPTDEDLGEVQGRAGAIPGIAYRQTRRITVFFWV